MTDRQLEKKVAEFDRLQRGYVEFDCVIVSETDKAIRIRPTDYDAKYNGPRYSRDPWEWLPKSQSRIYRKNDDGTTTIWVKKWLFAKLESRSTYTQSDTYHEFR